METRIKSHMILGAVVLAIVAGTSPSSSALPPGDPGESDPIITFPIITFNGVGLAEHGVNGAPGSPYLDAGSLEGTKDLATGEVNLLFTGVVGKVACGGGSGIAVIVGAAPEEGACSAAIRASNLDCQASFRFEGDQIAYSWGDGIGLCTVEEV